MPLSRRNSNTALGLLALALLCWLLGVANYLWMRNSADWGWLRWLLVLGAVPAGAGLVRRTRSQGHPVRAAAYTACFVLAWPVAVMLCDQLGWDSLRVRLAEAGLSTLFVVGLGWTIWGIERASQYYLAIKRDQPLPIAVEATLLERVNALRFRAILATALLGPLLIVGCIETPWNYVGLWIDAIRFGTGRIDSRSIDLFFWGLSFLGTLRVVLVASLSVIILGFWGAWFWRHPGIRNPLDQEAWYYGERGNKLNQSIAAVSAYSLAFLLAVMLFGQIGGCQEIYEMPAGGGKQTQIAQQVKIQKVVKKKFVINPFSSIIFNPPPIDEIKLQLTEVTAHQYRVGYGEGEGAGFAGGTSRGKVRFIRLEYSGGDWNHNFGVGADLNMLVEYGVRTGHKVADKTESRTVAQLAGFPAGKSPPMMYLTGQQSVSLSKHEIKILREYLLDKHGMLFGDNGGSRHFHNQFFAMMQQVLPNVEPVKIPLDDNIHRIPFQIPFLPYVSPHAGKEAYGWKVDGRWVCYYHPGEISDAWTDDHAGVNPEIYEYCYQLGTNIIFYAHAEYNKWLDARQKK